MGRGDKSSLPAKSQTPGSALRSSGERVWSFAGGWGGTTWRSQVVPPHPAAYSSQCVAAQRGARLELCVFRQCLAALRRARLELCDCLGGTAWLRQVVPPRPVTKLQTRSPLGGEARSGVAKLQTRSPRGREARSGVCDWVGRDDLASPSRLSPPNHKTSDALRAGPRGTVWSL